MTELGRRARADQARLAAEAQALLLVWVTAADAALWSASWQPPISSRIGGLAWAGAMGAFKEALEGGQFTMEALTKIAWKVDYYLMAELQAKYPGVYSHVVQTLDGKDGGHG